MTDKEQIEWLKYQLVIYTRLADDLQSQLNKKMDKLYTVKQVAEMLHVHPRIVRSLARDDGLPLAQLSDRVWRVSEHSLLEWIRHAEAKPKPLAVVQRLKIRKAA